MVWNSDFIVPLHSGRHVPHALQRPNESHRLVELAPKFQRTKHGKAVDLIRHEAVIEKAYDIDRSPGGP